MTCDFYEELKTLFQNDVMPAPAAAAPLDIPKILDYGSARDFLSLAAVNKESDELHLKDMPDRDYLDLSIICKMHVPARESTFFSIPVTYAFLRTWEITEKELFSQALDNTLRSPWRFCRLNLLSGLPVYSIADEHQLDGAAAILFPGVFEDFTEALRLPYQRYYVFATCIRRLYLIPEPADADPARLERLAADAPAALSSSLYFYDGTTGLIRIWKQSF